MTQNKTPSFFSKTTSFSKILSKSKDSSPNPSSINFSTYESLFPKKPPPDPPKKPLQPLLTSFFQTRPPTPSSNPLPFLSSKNKIPLKNSGLNPLTPYSPETISNWLYLTVKAIRQYQFQMVEISLFYNTLVCLPTGLGKTFIAAIVILNYYLWFPKGKIFFLAPTRPLVNQQKNALLELKSIDKKHIVEITGGVSAEKRMKIYAEEEKRVFFMTPQTLENDLHENRIEFHSITLVIFGNF